MSGKVQDVVRQVATAMHGEIKVGDFVDIRTVAVAVDHGVVTVRVPGRASLNQMSIAPHVVRNVQTRSVDAIAADAIINSYPAPASRKRA